MKIIIIIKPKAMINTEFTLLSKTTIFVSTKNNIVYPQKLKLLVSKKHMQISKQEVYIATVCIS